MQGTGTTDKNGKLIYEGDIVRDEGEEYWAVRWHRDLAQFALYWYDATKAGSNKEWNYEDSLGELVAHPYEIIGNIYEHPHLLETK